MNRNLVKALQVAWGLPEFRSGVRRLLDLDEVSVRVLTLEMMLALKSTPRPDEAGGRKDRADLAALRAVAAGS